MGPKFLEANVKRIQDGWEDTKNKATDRLQLLNETKAAFIGYAENSETIASDFEVAEEEIKKVEKIFNLESANADLKKRQDILKKTDDTINGLFSSINNNYNTMCITIPEDKKKGLSKEIKAVEEKLEVVGRFKTTVGKIEELVAALTAFDNSLKAMDSWKDAATAELKDIKEASGNMLPEDRVARTMDLQEDIASKLEILAANAKVELELMPQGDKVPADAQAFKDELKRITDYVKKLQADTKIECDKYSNNVKYWAEYRTGIKEFKPWLEGAEKNAAEGLSKPTDLTEVKALDDKVKTFEKNCVNFLKDLEEVDTILLKGLHLVIKSLDLSEVGGLRQTLSCVLLSSLQPGLELLDTSSVFGPVLDIVGVLVALNLGVSLKLLDIVGDSLQLVLESLGIGGNLVTLGQQFQLNLGVSSKNLELGSDVLLEVHGPGNSVLGQHVARGFLDVLQLGGGGILPGVHSLQGVVKSGESSNKLLNLSNSGLEAADNFKFLLNSLDF